MSKALAITFEQNTPATSWVIPHEFLGVPIVDINVFIEGALEKIHPAGVTSTSDTELTISFSSPRVGIARLAGPVAG
jgi:hypothetical protein